MKAVRGILFLLLLLENHIVVSQISPGALSSPHAHLEGISNCTKCHDIGKKVSIEKCFACHLDIKEKTENQQGYHSSKDVKEKSCIQCHSDHHGLKFEIVRFDKNKFNHELTGYELTGKHHETDCNKCHDNKWITDVNARKKKFTYLGLDAQCKTCHEDVHRGTLNVNCASCHSTVQFIPASKFDHKKTQYPLLGKHQDVKCIDCHKVEEAEGKKFQVFAKIKHDQCTACHQNVHDKNFGQNCTACHNELSFQLVNTKVNFNHNITGYALRGKHKTIDCKSCHKNALNFLQSAFRDFSNRPIGGCISCHKDIHENKFGQDCIQCHSEQSFKLQRIPDKFNHDLTAYKLEGKHEVVDCKKCHKANMTDALPHHQCIDCHTDFHQGQLIRNGQQKDCSACHVVQNFSEVLYSVEAHAGTKFPLEGAHLATPCNDCHKKGGQWNFGNMKTQCVDCHEDVHDKLLNLKYYEHKNCTQCHAVNTWKDTRFNHDLTMFKLEGKHSKEKCVTCHLTKEQDGSKKLIFSLLRSDCTSCHQDIHIGQFSNQDHPDCTTCHAFDNWKASRFDHNNAAFKLDGAHLKVACDLCHKKTMIKGFNCTQYKLVSFKCIDCHY